MGWWWWMLIPCGALAGFILARWLRDRRDRAELARLDEADDESFWGKIEDADAAYDPDAWRGDVHPADDESWRG